MDKFQIKGIEDLSEAEKLELNKILQNSYEKIKRKTKVDFALKLVVKVYSKGESKDNKDKRKHYSIKAVISGTVRQFEASSDGWDLNKAVHISLEALENEVEHVFHSSEQHS
jgi:hypothetical protein